MATARKTTTRRRNVAMGMTIGSGPGRVFHPFRSSSDYDPVLAGEKKKRKPAAKKKAVKKAAPKRKTTTKRVAVKKRAVVRKRTLAKKTVRRRNPPQKVYTLVWGPTGQKIATVTASNMKAAIRKAPAPYSKYKGEIYAEVSKAKNPPHTVTLPVARHMGSLYAQQGLTKQSAWEKFLAWARTRTTAVSLPADSVKRQKIKEAFLTEYDRTKGMKNPADKLIKGANLTADQRRQVYEAYVNRFHAIGPGKHYRNDTEWLYDHAFAFNKSGKLSGRRKWAPPHYVANPRRKLVKRGTPAKKTVARKAPARAPSGETLVAKSAYLASINKVRKMLPVNSRVAVVGVAPGAKKAYLLIVKKKDAAVARAVAQAAAKTMTKK